MDIFHSYQSYILIENVPGEKAPSPGTGMLATLWPTWGGGPNRVPLSRGELLASIPVTKRALRSDGKPAHNYRLKTNSDVTLYGGENDECVAPVKEGKKLSLLEGIEKPCDRFAVFSEEGKLEWGSNLKKGDQVYVKVPTPNRHIPNWSLAVVKYAGSVELLPGLNFGVEIKVN